MSLSQTALEDFVVVGVLPDAIQIKSSEGEMLLLRSSELDEVFDSVVRLTFRADPAANSGNVSAPIVLHAVVSRDLTGGRDRVEVIQLKLAKG